MTFSRSITLLTGGVALLTACGSVAKETPDASVDASPPVVAALPSRSAPIALNGSETVVAMTNQDNDSVSFFDAVTNARRATLAVGDEPSSVVFSPDGTIAYVAVRGDAKVVKIAGADTATPSVAASVDVGSEPTGIALSPTGATLYVAEFAEGRVAAIDTATMTEKGATTVPNNPRSLAVTNNGNDIDDDEIIVVPEFYGAKSGSEGSNDSRKGIVRTFKASDLSAGAVIELPVVTTTYKTGFTAGDGDDIRGNGATVQASPNQLTGISINQGKAFITSINAAPAAPVRFNSNVFSTVYTIDLATNAVAAQAGTIVLTDGIAAIVDAAAGVNFSTVKPTGNRLAMGDIADIANVPGRDVFYVVSRAADGVQRIAVAGGTVSFGSSQNKQIDVIGGAAASAGCKNPIGIAINKDATKAFVNCWISRRMAVVDLNTQTLADSIESAPFPAASSSDERVQLGRRFYFTGRGRWSHRGEGWSSCGSCHPDGYTDNITWIFGTGPRQTTSQDGSFSHGALGVKQRIFNWSAVFDEHHDFERNTRDTSGGLGAITRPNAGQQCGSLANETPLSLAGIGGLGKPLKVVNDTEAGGCVLKDWDEIDDFVKTIRPPRGLRKPDPQSVMRGRTIFTNANCAQCHGGAGWTVSRRFKNPPSEADNTTLLNTTFNKGMGPAVWTFHDGGRQIAAQPSAADPDGKDANGTLVNLPPTQMSCVVRNVGTFGVFGDTAATNSLEVRSAPAAVGASTTIRAQGRGGYNVPALYGLATGAPYLHHGQASSLEDLFTSPNYEAHRTSGAANFAPAGQELSDLINFLQSIDASTQEFAVPAGFDWCPAN